MSKRHRLRPGDWESVIGRLEELVLANSGEDEFEEIFKLIIAKLLAERSGQESRFQVGSSASQTADGINELLRQASSCWPGIIDGPARMKLEDEHLAVCVREIERYSLLDTRLEILDGLFEYLVTHSEKGAKGQFFTPRHVVECCVRMIDPKQDESVADPACGSGGFLIHTLRHVMRTKAKVSIADYAAQRLWGFDFDERAVRVAKALMLVAGDGSSNVVRLNSLLTPDANASLFGGAYVSTDPRVTIEDVMRTRSKGFQGFDVIVTNPPFAGEVREQSLLQSFELSKSGRRIERDVLFLERCVDLLRPGGRLAIVLPHNKLAGTAWGYVREWLVGRLRVVAVVGLGRHTFLPHTHQKTSVLFGVRRFKGERQSRTEQTFFAISERDGKDSRGQVVAADGALTESPLWERADHDLEEVVNGFAEFRKHQEVAWGKA